MLPCGDMHLPYGGIISFSKIIVVPYFDNVFMGYTSMD